MLKRNWRFVMRSWKYSVLGLALFLGGCKEDRSTALLIERPITTRPIVAVVPVMDRSHHNLTWNVSHELTAALRQKLTQHNNLYLLSEDQVYAMNRKTAQHDPFDLDVSWIKKGYPQNEFVAFFELTHHRETPLLTSEEESPAQLNVSMRVRVFDLRGETAKVVLEELVEQSHHIPTPFAQHAVDPTSSQVPWGDEAFEISPLGIAHEKLCKELAGRVEDYILLNCKL